MTRADMIARERDLLAMRSLTPDEARELDAIRAALALPEYDGPITATVRRMIDGDA